MCEASRLDQFYTSDAVARLCVETLIKVLPALGYDSSVEFLEPSAGAGAFLSALPGPAIGVDLDPKWPGVIAADFLKLVLEDFEIRDPENLVVVGNPPFGRRGKLAIDFFNHAARLSDTIAFIVPVSFRKWSVHRRLASDFLLISDTKLENNAFRYKGRSYHVNSAFQVWTTRDGGFEDQRIRSAPPASHPDFQAWIYNNTKEAEKFFKYDFDFAVPRQGFVDYSRRETEQSRCERSTHWILFKAGSRTVRRRLESLDFGMLSKCNTKTPGFGKADVIQAYCERYG
jgi:predicted RNA methylase